jgi:hypothetical protein
MEEKDFLALNVSQRKALQKELQAQGHYFGPIDGMSGTGLRTALKAAGKAKVDAEERSRRGRIEEEGAAAEAELKRARAKGETATAEDAAAKTKRRQEYNEQANSPWGIATQVGAHSAAPLAGYAAGRGMGGAINFAADLAQRNKNAKLDRLAESRAQGIVSGKGARAAAERSGLLPSQNSFRRVTGRMLPHIIMGLGAAGKGAGILASSDEDTPFYPRMANDAIGWGMLGSGVGVVEQGARYALSPGESPDAKSLAIIESEQLRRGQQAKPVSAKAALLAEAKAAGVKGAGKMNMKQLEAALSTIKRLPKSGFMAPIAAGALAYGMTKSPAEAADGEPSEETGRGRAATNALGAAGAAYGVTKGINKLAELGTRYAPRTMRVAGRVLPPVAAGLTAYDVVQGIDRLAHLSPPQDPGEYSTMGAFMPPDAAPNAMAAAGEQPDPFGQALNDFMGLVQGMGAP